MNVVDLQRAREERAAALPAAFIEWQIRARADLFEAMEQGRMPRFMAAHLPVVSTLNAPGAAFPIRSGNKGVGLMPAADHLPEYLAALEECLAWSAGKPNPETRAERIRVARRLYDQPDHLDRHTLGTIEIFRGETYQNLQRDPRASLLFTDVGPRYASWQMNAAVELVGPGDGRFRFLEAMRLLFEKESFHIQQPGFSVGYVFSLREVDDKTPKRITR